MCYRVEREDRSYTGFDHDHHDGDGDDDEEVDVDVDVDGHDGPQIHSMCTNRPQLLSSLTVMTNKSMFPTSGKVCRK